MKLIFKIKLFTFNILETKRPQILVETKIMDPPSIKCALKKINLTLYYKHYEIVFKFEQKGFVNTRPLTWLNCLFFRPKFVD